MSNWFPLDIGIGLFVLGVSLFILGHSVVCELQRYLHNKRAAVSERQPHRFTCEQH
jgi:hypothetical protein